MWLLFLLTLHRRKQAAPEALDGSGGIHFWRGLFGGRSPPPAETHPARQSSGEEGWREGGESRSPGFAGQERGRSVPSGSDLPGPSQSALPQP